MADPLIGGLPLVSLSAAPTKAGPFIVSAVVAPGRGMMLVQARVRLPDGRESDLLATPDLGEVARRLSGGPDDFAGNQSFAVGGAILLPFANRIRGRETPGAREIETEVAGAKVRLPRNWGGKAPGAAQYAMHGLILDQVVPAYGQSDPASVTARLQAGDFRGHWTGDSQVDFAWRLRGGGLQLRVGVTNAGETNLPIGIGWHPYFAVPSGRRDQVQLSLPARTRLEVNNYDEVLPTGGRLPVAGTAYDFSSAGGRALSDLYLDDCFTDLERGPSDRFEMGFDDPAAGLGLRITTESAAVKAVQAYAPPERPIVVLEPQFNWPDPYGAEWPSSADTGMALLPPGASTSYAVNVRLVAL